MKHYLLGALLLFTIGCGGGGGSSQDLSTPVTPQTTVRAPTSGDSWTYSVTGQSSSNGNYSGTETESQANDSYNGVACLRQTNSASYLFSNGTQTLIQTIWATVVSGVVTPIAVNLGTGNGNENVTASTNPTPTALTQHLSLAGSVTLSDGTVFDNTWTVTGTARVQTPAGTFDTWVVSHTHTTTSGETERATEYWAPELGTYVKDVINTTEPNGVTVNATAVLASTTVPH